MTAYRHDRALAAYRRSTRRERRAGAHAAVVGGSPISIEQAPWQVAVFAEVEFEGKLVGLLCGGSIVHDMSHVLTAGHCAIDPFTGQPLPANAFVVVAGVSSLAEIKEGPTSQARFVKGTRVHPYFDYAAGAGAPDDVAELELAKPLQASAAVAPVALPSSSVPPQEGTSAVLSGFGEEDPVSEELNGNLYSLGVTLGFSQLCGGEANALFLCGSSSGGTACSGDSGGGLLGGSPQQLIGVVDTVAIVGGQHCAHGADDGFADVTAPEILDFVAGSESPPRAPRGGGAAIRGIIRAGQSLTCEPGSWTNGPTFTYSFVNSASGQVLQQASSSIYALTSADVGRTILCQVQAVNAGGTGIGRTLALPPIEAEPTVPVSPVTGSSAGGALQTPAQTGELPSGGVLQPPAQAGEPPSGGVLGSTIPNASPAQIAALLRRALAPSGRGAKIASLTQAGGFTVTFMAPEAGTVNIAWYRVAGAVAESGVKAKPVLIASGQETFSKAATGRVVVKLTAAGRRALRGKAHVAVIAKGSFTPLGNSPITVSRGLTLSR